MASAVLEDDVEFLTLRRRAEEVRNRLLAARRAAGALTPPPPPQPPPPGQSGTGDPLQEALQRIGALERQAAAQGAQLAAAERALGRRSTQEPQEEGRPPPTTAGPWPWASGPGLSDLVAELQRPKPRLARPASEGGITSEFSAYGSDTAWVPEVLESTPHDSHNLLPVGGVGARDAAALWAELNHLREEHNARTGQYVRAIAQAATLQEQLRQMAETTEEHRKCVGQYEAVIRQQREQLRQKDRDLASLQCQLQGDFDSNVGHQRGSRLCAEWLDLRAMPSIPEPSSTEPPGHCTCCGAPTPTAPDSKRSPTSRFCFF
eukprot:EG_transcript_12666